MKITREIFAVLDGSYGYKIFRDGNLFIRQNHMPAVPGMKLMTREVVEKVSTLVMDKVQQRPNELPTVTIEELARL